MQNDYEWVKYYDNNVPANIDIPEIPLWQLLRDAAAEAPNRIALRMVLRYLPFDIAIQAKYTYREVDQLSDRFAAELSELGTTKGDRVALMLPNIPQYVIAFFGILKIGAIVVNTNPTYTAHEMRHQLVDSGAKAIVLMSGAYERLAGIRDEIAVESVIVADIEDSLGWPLRSLVEKQARAKGTTSDLPQADDIYRFKALTDRVDAALPAVEFSPDDIALFQYSGGTTGTPKAAMLSHRNLVSNAHQMVTWFTPMEHGKDRFMAALPFFHVYGMSVGILAAMLAASEIVMTPDPRDPKLNMQIMQNERITVFPGVPAMYSSISNHPDVEDFSFASVKACLSAGAPLPVEVGNKFEAITGSILAEGYGLTEASPLVCANPIQQGRRFGSIGVPIPNTRLSIVALEPEDDGTYRELGPGEEGEIVVYGPQVMAGYWNADEETETAIDNTGGLHTGDIGVMDEEYHFTVVDRKKDLIIASGYNVVPREIEEVLFAFPKVVEAAVAGIPHPRRGETVKAFIVLQPKMTATKEEIQAFCRERLAPYKVPTDVEFRLELPKSQVGKVLRRILVEEELAKMSGISPAPATS